MNKYVIAFDYKPFPDSEPITEYFLPYTQEELLKIITDRTLRRRLIESKKTKKNLDTFVEQHNLQNNPHIRRMDNLFFGADSPNWINDTADISEPSQWDFLADAITIASAEKYHFDYSDYINALAVVTHSSRLHFYYLKLVLSLLIYTGDDDEPEEGYIPYDDNPDSNLSPDVYKRFQDFYKKVSDFLRYDIYPFDINVEKYRELAFHNHDFQGSCTNQQ